MFHPAYLPVCKKNTSGLRMVDTSNWVTRRVLKRLMIIDQLHYYQFIDYARVKFPPQRVVNCHHCWWLLSGLRKRCLIRTNSFVKLIIDITLGLGDEKSW